VTGEDDIARFDSRRYNWYIQSSLSSCPYKTGHLGSRATSTPVSVYHFIITERQRGYDRSTAVSSHSSHLCPLFWTLFNDVTTGGQPGRSGREPAVSSVTFCPSEYSKKLLKISNIPYFSHTVLYLSGILFNISLHNVKYLLYSTVGPSLLVIFDPISCSETEGDEYKYLRHKLEKSQEVAKSDLHCHKGRQIFRDIPGSVAAL
jgi:hypothetical protein